jgi:hypothetical protein
MWWVGEWAWSMLGLRTVPLHHTRHDTVEAIPFPPPSSVQLHADGESPGVEYSGGLLLLDVYMPV